MAHDHPGAADFQPGTAAVGIKTDNYLRPRIYAPALTVDRLTKTLIVCKTKDGKEIKFYRASLREKGTGGGSGYETQHYVLDFNDFPEDDHV